MTDRAYYEKQEDFESPFERENRLWLDIVSKDTKTSGKEAQAEIVRRVKLAIAQYKGRLGEAPQSTIGASQEDVQLKHLEWFLKELEEHGLADV